MSVQRDTVDRTLTPEEIAEQVESLRTIGGVYTYVAACVEYDNRDQPLAPNQLETLERFGIPATELNQGRTTP